MNRTDYLTLAHSAPAELGDVPAFLSSLGLPVFDMFRAGVLKALSEKFPSVAADPEFLDPATIVETVAPSSPAWNDFHLGYWAARGDGQGLTELIRRALHRDGSPEADAVGTDMIGLLSEAVAVDPLLGSSFAEVSFSLGSVRFGVYPPNSGFTVADVRPVSKVPGAARRRVPDLPMGDLAAPLGSPSSAVSSVPIRAAAGNEAAAADLSSGTVVIGTAQLSIVDAIKLRDGITIAVVDLLRPAEGFAWLDDSADPQAHSILLDLDGERGRGLTEAGGGFVQAEVIQIAARGPDANAGKYIGRVYLRDGGYREFMTGADEVNAAKFKVAERVRQGLL